MQRSHVTFVTFLICACAFSFRACALSDFTMQCLHPLLLTCYGKRIDDPSKSACFVTHCSFDRIKELNKLDPDKYFPVPCGKCLACKQNRRQQWNLRLQAESWTNPLCSFVTLTYNNEHLPPGIPDKSDIQNFIKRFRHLKRDYHLPLDDFKYFFVIELGTQTHRPHYHGVVFGADFLAPHFKPYLATVNNGYAVYSSPILERIWSKGFVSVDLLTPASINYVTKYVLKTLDQNGLWFVYSRNIGRDFFFDSERGTLTDSTRAAYLNGTMYFGSSDKPYPSAPPRFVDRLLKKYDPELADHVSVRRKTFLAQAKTDNRSPEELLSAFQARVKETLTKGILDNG